MTLKREETEFFVLNEQSDLQTDDVPFYNEYVKLQNVTDITILEGTYVLKVFQTAKGLLLIGDCFKYFIFCKSELYGFILEYLEKYNSHELYGPRLVMFPSTKSKASIGVNKSDPLCFWDKNKTCYTCTLPNFIEKSIAKEKKRTKPNPLLS